MLLVPAFRALHVPFSTIISLLGEDVKHIEKIDWGQKNTYYQSLTLMTAHLHWVHGFLIHTKLNGFRKTVNNYGVNWLKMRLNSNKDSTVKHLLYIIFGCLMYTCIIVK